MIATMSGQKVNMILDMGVSSRKDMEGLSLIVNAAIDGGIMGFDVAPSYGTESRLGRCLRRGMEEYGISRENVFVQTKVDAWQMMKGPDKVRMYALDAIKKMSLNYLDALLIHWPVPEYFEQIWECLVNARKEGIARNIGVCNVRMR